MNSMRLLFALGFCLSFLAAFGPVRAATEIAVTVDDLPGHALDKNDRVKTVEVMLAALRKHHLTALYDTLPEDKLEALCK